MTKEVCILANTQVFYKPLVLLAHHANDVAESRLFQFLTGRDTGGIREDFVQRDEESEQYVIFKRPLLSFTKEDLVRYAEAWGLVWCEDRSNSTNKYTRNWIRNKLIPLIEKDLNPGIVKMLSTGFFMCELAGFGREALADRI